MVPGGGAPAYYKKPRRRSRARGRATLPPLVFSRGLSHRQRSCAGLPRKG
jgi:hypothetical protein